MRMPWSGDKGNTGSKKRQSIADLLFSRAKMHWWVLGVVFVLAVVWIAFPMENSRRLLDLDGFDLGEKSPRDVFAPFDFTYYDETSTEEEKQNALMDIPPAFDLDFQRLENAKEEFNIVRQVRASYIFSDEEEVDRMKRLFYIGPSDEVGLILATASDEQIDVMEEGVIKVLSDILAEGVVAGGDGGSFTEELSKIDYIKPKLEQIRRNLGGRPTNAQIVAKMYVTLVDSRSDIAVEKTVLVEKLRIWSEATMAARDIAKEMPEPIGTVVKEICVDLMRPNLIYNPILTQKRQDDLLSNFPSIRQNVSKGDRVVGVGELVI